MLATGQQHSAEPVHGSALRNPPYRVALLKNTGTYNTSFGDYALTNNTTGYGNAGVSIMNGPGQVNTDFSIGKRSRVGGLREDAQLAFRAEFYNALNRAQFANPGSTLGTASFGVITQTSVAPRLIQFGLKYQF